MPSHAAQDHPWCNRRSLPHQPPAWVQFDAAHLLTVCSRPRKRNQLAREDVAVAVWRSLVHHQDRGAWRLHALVVMPDHVHVLVSVPPATDLRHLMTHWKRYLARVHAIRWQRDFFEHRLRASQRLEERCEYLRLNPVRAGLARTPDEWPWFWRLPHE